jgi:hypothetical protein
MEPDCRVALRTKSKEETTDRFLILALVGLTPAVDQRLSRRTE